MSPATGDDAPRLFLLDGSALAYRSHFAFIRSPLSNSAGMSTGGTFGFARAVLGILDQNHPTHVAVVFDASGPTFRHEVFPEYKATREKMPEELREQLPWMKRIVEAMGIPLLEVPGYEADDVIGTLARRGDAAGMEVRIVSGDKDFMQLVTDRILLHNIMKGDGEVHLVGAEEVREKFGVPPEGVVDVLALMGDSSDNVPGIPGVGEKTARGRIATYGTLEAALDAADEIKQKKLAERLREGRDSAVLSKHLVTIVTDLDLDCDLEDLARTEPHRRELADLFRELEFNSLAERFSKNEPDAISQDYRIVADADELEAMIAELTEAGEIAFDLETTGLDVLTAEIVGLSFSAREGRAFYVPLNAEPPVLPDPDRAPRGTAVLERLRPFLAAETPRKGAQNAKYDVAVLRSNGFSVGGLSFDTMLASYLLEPSSRDHNLDALSLKHFAFKKIKTEEIIGKKGDQITMDLVPVETVGEYACEDADFTWRLWELFRPRLEEAELLPLFGEIEVPLVPVLVRMEAAGIALDVPKLERLAQEMQEDLVAIEKEIHALAGREFNIASPKQLSELLFVEMELHKKLGVKPRRTKTGFSTDQEVLEAMHEHPLPAKILEYRSLAKLLGTYVTSLPKLVHPVTGRIHSSFNQAVAATGRLSSSDPNLQNIPIRSARGRRIREAFVASGEGRLLFAADYSQIELRIMAHVTGDPALIAAFAAGADIHRETAAKVFEVAPGDVDGEMRARAKSINFGIMYGMGPQRLARETGMTVPEAEAFIARYFENFPTVRGFIEGMKENARRDGYVTTLFGRRRPIPDITSTNGRLRSAAENMAVNTPIQGSAADLIKKAMIAIDRWILDTGSEGKMILQVHDELVFDLPESELATYEREIPRLMGGVAELSVPLAVETGHGLNWSEAH
ncbi:MAG: DNA polymerase I [Planctomycetota bacterium]